MFSRLSDSSAADNADIADADVETDVETECARLDVTLVRGDSLPDTPHFEVWSYGRALR